MTVISNSVEIRCTPEEAFDYLSDHRSELEWNPGIESIDKLTDGPIGLGTRYLAKWMSAPKAVEVETIAYDRPHGWTVHNGGPVEVTVAIRLQPTAEGTRLSSDFDARLVPARLPPVPRQDPQGRSSQHDLHQDRPGTPRVRRPGQLAMRRLTTRPDRAPVTGPAAWLVRFAGLNGIICPLGFGAFTIPSILSVARGSGIVYVWGTQYSDHVLGQPYGIAPLEQTGTRATVLLLMVAFLAACLVQLVGGILLICLRPSGFVVMPAGMLLSAIFWWGFDLPFAWINATIELPLLAAAWLVYRRTSRKLPAAAPPERVEL